MLPGFRFLFGAVVLSMSILVFGFGAAALLRTAHEEFANTPTWQPAPETRFAQSQDTPPAAPPVLAMLRVDEPPKDTLIEPTKVDPPATNEAVTTGAADQSASATDPVPQPDRDKIAALPAPLPSAPAETATPAPPDVTAASDVTKLATVETAPVPASEAASAAPAEPVAAPEQLSPPRSAETAAIETKIATLGGPPVPIGLPVAKAASAKSDTDAVKKRQHARREKRRHSVARARPARQVQALDPFGQPIPTATATR